jgi:hypothetical protein
MQAVGVMFSFDAVAICDRVVFSSSVKGWKKTRGKAAGVMFDLVVQKLRGYCNRPDGNMILHGRKTGVTPRLEETLPRRARLCSW